jgi:hypothetical protein
MLGFRLDVGRDTSNEELPSDLGDHLERAIDAIRRPSMPTSRLSAPRSTWTK